MMTRALLVAVLVLAAGVALARIAWVPQPDVPITEEAPIRQAAIPVPTVMPSAEGERCENRKGSRADFCFDPLRTSWDGIPADTTHIEIHRESITLRQRFSYNVPPDPPVFVFPTEAAGGAAGPAGFPCYAAKDFAANVFAVTPTHQQRLNGMAGTAECVMPRDLIPATPLEHAVRAMSDDRRKPRFEGVMGPFEVVADPSGKPRNLTCGSLRSHFGSPGEPSDTIMNRRQSSLFLQDGAIERIESCDWQVTSVRQLPGTAVIERGYFDRERVLVIESAPEERIRLTEIEGRPALEVLPVPGHFLAHSRLVLIESPASGGKPGLFLSVETQDGPEATREIVRKILGG